MSLPEPAFVTHVVRATRRSTSLRVTIPQVVASTLELQPGDPVRWILDPHDHTARLARAPRDLPTTDEVATVEPVG